MADVGLDASAASPTAAPYGDPVRHSLAADDARSALAAGPRPSPGLVFTGHTPQLARLARGQCGWLRAGPAQRPAGGAVHAPGAHDGGPHGGAAAAVQPSALANIACSQRPPLARLALLGRHTLSLYIGSSLLSLAVLSGAGLALPLGTAALAVLALLYWAAWVALVQRWRGRLPLELWLSR
ncbi:MAG: DUF418 domain-containing protein [Massilia sp.]|nr:MAG: DUF418 domain-containing protein [Massilia sp.]